MKRMLDDYRFDDNLRYEGHILRYMPDANVQLAEYKKIILEQETNWDFIRPEIDKLAQEHQDLFRKWMILWTDFVTGQLEATPESTFPAQRPQLKVKQVLFPGYVLPCPSQNKYAEVRNYINERIKYDHGFKAFFETRTRIDFCNQLTIMFGWIVDSNHLGKRLNYKKNH